MDSNLSSDQLNQMLEEVAGYEVELSSDPTLPHLGQKYLQNIISKCRNYTNRTLFYLQAVMRNEKSLKREVKQLELDLEFKTNEKLSDDPIVRAQPSIEDRKALAAALLRAEHENIAQFRVQLIDVQETVKILRMRYNDLQRTSNDIKLQRTIVKDDLDSRMSGGAGYDKPQTRQDGSIPGGLPAPISLKIIDPKDILDPTKRPDDMPEPRNDSEAGVIANFLSRHPDKTSDDSGFQYTGKHCIICKKQQFISPSGVTCDLGHGDAPSIEDSKPSDVTAETLIDYASLLD